jgi:hypothetical protein
MSCAAWEDKIAQYSGGDLATEDLAAMEAHLRACVGCAELARGLECDRVWLQARPADLAGVDFDGMRRRLRGEIVRRRRIRRWVPAAAAMAAALLLAVAFSPQHGKPPAVVAPLQTAQVRPQVPPIRPVAALPEPSRGAPTASAAPPVEMRITTADPDVIIILVPPTTENPYE